MNYSVSLSSFFCGLILSMATNSLLAAQASNDPKDLSGDWLLELAIAEETTLPIHFSLKQNANSGWEAVIRNGSESLSVEVQVESGSVLLSFPHYDSQIQLQGDGTSLKGKWTKTRGADKIATLACHARRLKDDTPSASVSIQPFLGRFRVQFADSDDFAVGIFRQSSENQAVVEGTFLTTTGDYRFLSGRLSGETLTLSCFDGGHAFLFTIKPHEKSDQLQGVFYSGDWYQVTWTATRDADVQLPDGFAQSRLTEDFTTRSMLDLRGLDLTFPDLDGRQQRLDSPEFFGKATLIEVFGSWCPNCHDEAKLLYELQQEYGAQGLKILGLAFELTGDLKRDTEQVQQYIKRHQVDYPVLIAGTSDKKIASETLPILDRIRSYPTTLFVDKTGKIRSVYTGFSGPATGEAHERLKTRFKSLIEELLAE